MTDGMNVKSKMKRPCERETMRFHRKTIHCPKDEGGSTSLQLTDSEGPRVLLGDQRRRLRPSAVAGPGCGWRLRPIHDSLRAEGGDYGLPRAAVLLRCCRDTVTGPVFLCLG